jgi:hypothetical protein
VERESAYSIGSEPRPTDRSSDHHALLRRLLPSVARSPPISEISGSEMRRRGGRVGMSSKQRAAHPPEHHRHRLVHRRRTTPSPLRPPPWPLSKNAGSSKHPPRTNMTTTPPPPPLSDIPLPGVRLIGRPGQCSHLHWQVYSSVDVWPSDDARCLPPGSPAEEWDALRNVQKALAKERKEKGTQMYSHLIRNGNRPSLAAFDANMGPHSTLEAKVRAVLPNCESCDDVSLSFVSFLASQLIESNRIARIPRSNNSN